LGDDVPSTGGRRLAESLGEEDLDLGLGWPRRDEWSRTYVNSGGVFCTRVDEIWRDFQYLLRFKSYPRN
jgi:hypothetical protein